MRWRLLIAVAVLNTALLLIGFRYWQMLAIDAGVALAWIVLTGLWKHHAPSMFAARIAGALFDLGLETRKLDDRLHEKLQIESLAVFRANKGEFSHHSFAVRFFVYALVDIENGQFQAVVSDGAMTRSIAVIRKWAKDGKISTDEADREIGKIKDFLIDGLASFDGSDAERIAIEIQILEL